MIVKHSLWRKLLEVDADARNRYRTRFDPGIGCLGLILHEEPVAYEYWCTPKNSITFATTGGDGVHFSFLIQDDAVTDRSPVIITVPAAFGAPNWIGGENLYDFLCFGYFRGYFAMEQVAYDLDLTLRVFTDPAWQPTEDWHHSVGYSLDDEKAKILEFLVNQANLRPWVDASHFGSLQDQYCCLLELPE